MTAAAFFVGGVFRDAFFRCFFVAGFTILVERQSKILDFPVAFIHIVTLCTSINVVSFLPYIFAVLILVVTLLAGHIIAFNVVQMGKCYRPFSVCFVPVIVDDDFFGDLLFVVRIQSGYN